MSNKFRNCWGFFVEEEEDIKVWPLSWLWYPDKTTPDTSELQFEANYKGGHFKEKSVGGFWGERIRRLDEGVGA